MYHPLVVDPTTSAAVAPTVPTLPANAVVGLWFTTNAERLRLNGTNLAANNCVDGLGSSIFGHFAYCNAVNYFVAAESGSASPLLTAQDGGTCITTHDFAVVDKDQSDTVYTTYLITANGQIAQNTAANRNAFPGFQIAVNGDDTPYVNEMFQQLGCNQLSATSLTELGQSAQALALDELQADWLQPSPQSIIPDFNPQVTVNGVINVQKRNLYRAGVGQNQSLSGDQRTWCHNYATVAPQRFVKLQTIATSAESPDPTTSSNLFTFCCNKFTGSFQELNCSSLLGIPNPVTLVTQPGGMVTGCSIQLGGAGTDASIVVPT